MSMQGRVLRPRPGLEIMKMRRSLVALAALGGAAAFGLAAPASAFASSTGEIEISPRVVEPGGSITLSTEACRSEAHVWVVIDGVKHGIELETRTSEGVTGSFTVPRDADQGRYEVEGTCQSTGKALEGDFRVSNEPEGGPSTGAGGSVSGTSLTETAGGAVLAATAAAGGIVLLRRRHLNGQA
jgi:hypothetical protein